MKPSGTYKCAVCKQPTGTLHEVFFGTAGRKVCIEYNCQVPLCQDHHSAAHGITHPGIEQKTQAQWKLLFCDILGIHPDAARLAVESKYMRSYLADHADDMKRRIDAMAQ